MHPVLFVFVLKTNKFQFIANGMRTVRRRRSTGLQSCSHIRAFGSQVVHEWLFGLQVVHEWFANHSVRSCIRGFNFLRATTHNFVLCSSKLKPYRIFVQQEQQPASYIIKIQLLASQNVMRRCIPFSYFYCFSHLSIFFFFLLLPSIISL